MHLKKVEFILCAQVLVVLLKYGKTTWICENIYIRKGILLRNTTTDWFEKFSRCLYEVPRLEKLDAKNINITLYNLVTHLPSNRSKELKYLSVMNSDISVIYKEAFGPFANIKTISLENNHIQTLQERAFFNLLKLRVIDLSVNELVHINAYVFVNLPKLEVLFLYDNALKYIANDALQTVASGSNIFRINIHNNQLNELPYRALCNTSVTEINADGNNISEITEDIYLLRSLETLYLNNNSLTTIDKDMFQLLNRSLGENRIKIGGNPWRCDCKLYWVIELVQIYNVTDNIVCNEPEHRTVLYFELDTLVCNFSQGIIATGSSRVIFNMNTTKDAEASATESNRSLQTTQHVEIFTDDNEFQSYDGLPKQAVVVLMIVVLALTTLGISAACFICLLRNRLGNKHNQFKMITNRHYYRTHTAGNRQYYSPQSVLAVSPIRVSNSRYKENKQNLGTGFTDIAVHGRLKLEKLLGRGAFGEVYEGFDAEFNKTGRKVAVKRIKDNASQEEMDTLIEECENLMKIGAHPNIIEVYGTCVINGSRAIVMELAEHGDLRDSLRKYYTKNRRAIINLDRSEEASYLMSQCPRWFLFMWQIAKGMEYLSNMKILHRDLAARNILLAKGPIAKISDFGLSRDVYESGYYYQESGGRLPYKWMSPETLIDGKYTTESDVWSYGVLLWEMVTLGSSPFPGIPPDMLISMHNSGYVMPQPSLCPDNIYSVMVDCWKYAPKQRPKFKTLVKDLDEIIQRSSKQTYIDLSKVSSTASCSVDEE